MELSKDKEISEEQLNDIKAHLRIVFRYDIDIGYGDKAHQKKLSKIHNPGDYTTAINC